MILYWLALGVLVGIFAEAIVAQLVFTMRINHINPLPTPKQQQRLALCIRIAVLFPIIKGVA